MFSIKVIGNCVQFVINHGVRYVHGSAQHWFTVLQLAIIVGLQLSAAFNIDLTYSDFYGESHPLRINMTRGKYSFENKPRQLHSLLSNIARFGFMLFPLKHTVWYN